MGGMSNRYRAAYVPFTDDMSWDDAAALAVTWLMEQAKATRARPLLVTNTFGPQSSVPSLAWLCGRADHVTPRSDGRQVPGGQPVLAYVPTAEAFDLAARRAGSVALSVVESRDFGLAGWAAGVTATNLITDEVTPELASDVADLLDRLKFYGNNGYTDQFGKGHARTIVGDLKREGAARDIITSDLAAQGISPRGVKTIGQLFDEA